MAILSSFPFTMQRKISLKEWQTSIPVIIIISVLKHSCQNSWNLKNIEGRERFLFFSFFLMNKFEQSEKCKFYIFIIHESQRKSNWSDHWSTWNCKVIFFKLTFFPINYHALPFRLTCFTSVLWFLDLCAVNMCVNWFSWWLDP